MRLFKRLLGMKRSNNSGKFGSAQWSVALPLKQRLLIIVLSSFLIPIGLLGYLWYTYANESIERQAYQTSDQLLMQASNAIEDYLQELERLTIPILLNPAIQSFFQLSPDDYYGQYQLQREVRKELYQTLYNSRSDLYKFTLIMNEKLFLSSSEFALDDRVKQYLKLLELEAAPLPEFHLEGVNWVEGLPIITAYKIVEDPLDPYNRGLLIADVKLTRFAEMMQSLKLTQSGEAFIVNQSGHYLVHPDSSRIGQAYGEEGDSLFQPGVNGYTIEAVDGQRMLTSYRTLDSIGWTLYFQIPMSVLTHELVALSRTSLLLVFVLLLLALVFTGGYAYRSIHRMMVSYKKLLIHEHQTVMKVKDLELRHKESLLKALQSQINPHFLYNTLGMIHAHAIIAEAPKVSRIIVHLAHLFRYNMKLEPQIVTLADEVESIEHYFQIHRERHEKLQTEMALECRNIWPKVRSVKLLLQPLIENAFQRGYDAHQLPPSLIRIEGTLAEDGYQLDIIDRGGGMPAATKERLNAIFMQHAMSPEVEGVDEGIGLMNVHRRIQLVFGKRYGLFIIKSDATGTIVRVKIPYEEKE